MVAMRSFLNLKKNEHVVGGQDEGYCHLLQMCGITCLLKFLGLSAWVNTKLMWHTCICSLSDMKEQADLSP